MLYRDNRPNRNMCKRFFGDNLKTYSFRALRGPGGLHRDFLKIDFLVVSDREE